MLGFFPGDTVVYVCLQLLCGWKSREILIFGMDLSGARCAFRASQRAENRVGPTRRQPGHDGKKPEFCARHQR